MSAHAYTEDQLVEQPAIALFAELGWQTVAAIEEKFGAGGTLGRETSGQVVLPSRLRAVLDKLIPRLPAEAIAAAVEELVALSRVLTEEQGRHVREHLSEEELTIFDILTRPGPQLSTGEREEVKKVARQLLSKLHEILVLGWRQKIQARAKVRVEIENVLDDGLPRAYGKEMFEEKCGTLFEHLFESCQGKGESVFTQAL